MKIPSDHIIKVMLIDDEFQSRKALRYFIKDYCPQVEIIGEAQSVLAGYKLLRKQQPDAIFLDVRMDDGTGFDLLNKFPSPSFQVIFTTAFDEFAIKAFRYNAIDYLLKPIDIDELISAVDKISRRSNQSNDDERIRNLLSSRKSGKFDKIAVSSNEGLHFLELEDIIRLASDGNYTTFYLLNRKPVTIAKTLKSFDQLLSGDIFFRPHQSHLINLQHVEKILREDGGYLLMKDGNRIPISRSKKDQFMALVRDRFIQ